MTDLRDPAALAATVRSCDEAGYRKLFSEIVEAYRAPIYALGYRITGQPEDADDVAQETFLQVWRSLRVFRGDAQVYTWIYRIAIRKAQEVRRRQTQSVGARERSAAPAGGMEAASRSELRVAIEEALASLSDEHRLVVSLFAIGELSHLEIADVLEVPVGTVWSRLHHARRTLAEKLRPHL